MVRRLMSALTLTLILTASFAGASFAADEEQSIRLVAAGSLREPFAALIAEYGAAHKVRIEPKWGPSGALRESLQRGEPFDIFASAALPHAQALTDKGLSGPSVLFARNELCAVVRADSAIHDDNLVASLIDPATRVATSTPKSDPGGDYAWALFARIDKSHPGAFAALSGKAQQIFGGPSTTGPLNGRHRLALALDEKSADIALYYCSWAKQAASRPGEGLRALQFPPDLAVGAQYGVTVSVGASKAAGEFAFFLLSPKAQAVLRDHGFIPVTLPSER
jgi:molybdate transport system substrate-binding protein